MNGRKMKDYKDREFTRYYIDLYDDNEGYADVKEVLDKVEGKSALIKDAVIKYVRGDGFKIERYIGNASRRDIK